MRRFWEDRVESSAAMDVSQSPLVASPASSFGNGADDNTAETTTSRCELFHQRYYLLGHKWNSRRPAYHHTQTREFSSSATTLDDRGGDEEPAASRNGRGFAPGPDPASPPRPWLDPNRDLKDRAAQFLDSPKVHPAAHKDITPLIRQLCKTGTLEGMRLATDIVERLVVEKRRMYEEGGEGGGGESERVLVCIPAKRWEILLYGWGVMASSPSTQHHRVAEVRMKDVLRRAIEEANWDEERYIDVVVDDAGGDVGDEEDGNLKQHRRVHRRQTQLESLPTVDIFNTYLHGLAQVAKGSRSVAVPNRAWEVLEAMRNNCDRWRCRPNTKSFTHVLVACANSQHHRSGRLALDVLRKMHDAHREDKRNYEAQYGVPYHSLNPKMNKRKIVTPDVLTYTVTMKALIDSGRDAHMALDLMRELSKLADCADDDGLEGGNDFYYLSEQLDMHVFVTAISALSKLIETERKKRRLDYAQQAEKILCAAIDFVKSKQQKLPTSGVSSDGDDETSTWKASDSGGYNCLLPAFHACLDAWSRAYVPEAPERCERILRMMLAGAGVGSEVDNLYPPDTGNDTNNDDELLITTSSSEHLIPKPDTAAFNCCLFAWSRANKFHDDAAEKASELLLWQHELCDKGVLGSESVPDFQSYALAILARSHSPKNVQSKAQDARRILDTMLNNVSEKVKPSRNPTAPFSAVLSAAAKTPPSSPPVVSRRERTTPKAGDGETANSENASHDYGDFFNSVVETESEVYSLAAQTYQEVVNDAHKIGTEPDHHFVAAMLRCIAQHCDAKSAERKYMASSVFETACQQGHVSRLVVDGLVAAFGEEDGGKKEDVMAAMNLKKMPRLWYRNVPSSFRYYGEKRKRSSTRGSRDRVYSVAR